MRQPLHKAAAVGFLLFLLLWVVGLFRAPTPATAAPAFALVSTSNDGIQRLQAANNLRALKMHNVPAPLLLERQEVEGIRVHEKTSHLTAVTSAFSDDELAIRLAVAGHDALVLNERSSGVGGQRRLSLDVSVRPEQFDELTAQLRKIGRLETVSVQQRDRTDEFHRLREQQRRLKQQRDAVSKVGEGQVASVEDRLRILQKLQEIDKEQQTIALQAGDLLGKESYYHVYLTLNEDLVGASTHAVEGFPRRAGHAVLWALPWWLVVVAMLGVVPAVYVSVRALLPGRAANGSDATTS